MLHTSYFLHPISNFSLKTFLHLYNCPSTTIALGGRLFIYFYCTANVYFTGPLAQPILLSPTQNYPQNILPHAYSHTTTPTSNNEEKMLAMQQEGAANTTMIHPQSKYEDRDELPVGGRAAGLYVL
ncbi:hypothetical protein L873DRAFT_914089 [Choiromyces venosus 120613-1]|uniref:Uncharacterized protein n=1 Tax=Choiromyces venosus 120613-1 TaxID=1336337 RepID=A0A3N4IRT8_9PEZI|nr:hypothetical protein L873DRAFT_914089 [Choiromyces venosus 120613-1]